MVYDEKIVKYFWDHVLICMHGLTCQACCWPWQGTRGKYGHGQLSIYDKERYAQTRSPSRTLKASRLALEITQNAFLPQGIWALHACNNPPCCNPNPGHVYAGTPKDNSRDTLEAGHHVSLIRRETIARGTNHWMHQYPDKARAQIEQRTNTRLTPPDAIRICELYGAGFPEPILAEMFCITRQHVNYIVTGKKWARYTRAYLPNRHRQAKSGVVEGGTDGPARIR